ncbi:MAG: acyl-CoA thioesterase [Marinicaulis sp.]|nr:acyl-CoA thioesterase [Marinicaulis sp.]NNE39837.1 acyl-CoA thioesterase [Marinicaulis sp.]
MKSEFDWPVENPYLLRKRVTKDDIDEYGHVNNVRYVEWAADIAWRHSQTLGIGFSDYERLGVGCVVWRHEFDYKKPLLPDEEFVLATWISGSDKRLRVERSYEIRSATDGSLNFSGKTLFVTIDMRTGKPARMPQEFIDAYRPA